MLTVAGSCSFCGKTGAEVVTLVGTAQRSTRICDECVGLCCDILEEEGLHWVVPSEPREAFRLAVDRRAAEEKRQVAAAREAFLRLPEAERQAIALARQARRKELRRRIEAAKRQEHERSAEAASTSPPMVTPETLCSFCDRPRRDVARLVSGPHVYICERCAADAALTMAHLIA